MTTVRIPPLAPAHHPTEVRELLASIPYPPARTGNGNTTVAQHPALFIASFPFSGVLLFSGVLPARDRELVILRTAHLADSTYVLTHHRGFGLRAGLTETEVARTAAGPEAEGWSPHDAALLTAADELHRLAVISDDTWNQLAARYDTPQLIEVTVLAGYYRMWSAALNSFGTAPDPDPAAEEGSGVDIR
ncbi:carboxymuconolactone decarboxylase family protein [Streptomyces sp. NPDC020965]|uniref:carboxymuconolactone decarboxylase family protein n=1 Tax=Streptomyces sp. NPDC020965 TaxID=3365105 RepID=UPI0037A3FE66